MKPKLQLLALFALFFIPVLVAYWLNTHPEIWKPGATVNHGTLIQPAIHVDEYKITMDDGEIVDSNEFSNYWLIFSLCNSKENCVKQGDKLERLRLMTGRHASRVKFLTLHKNEIGHVEYEHELRIGYLPETLGQILNQTDEAGTWIIDPRGYLMMHYQADFIPQDFKKDMDRLLKYNEQDKVSFEQ
ncbi:MAG: hypothetical protein ACWA5R_04410 [bacterium]